MKKILTKIICLGASALCLNMLSNIKGHNVCASSELNSPTIREYNDVKYSGLLIDSENVKSFSKTLDLSNCNLDTSLFQFVVTPNEIGVTDFTKLTFKFADSKGKAFTVGFVPRNDYPKNEYINGLASGQNQTLLGEHQNNYKYIDENSSSYSGGAYLNDNYAGITPYTFYGVGCSMASSFTKNNGFFNEGENGIIGIYYDSLDKAVYSDTGFGWVEDDSSKPWTLTDKYTRSATNEKRFRIRDLDYDSYKKGKTIVSAVWDGFLDPSNVTMTISFSNVKTKTPSILLLSVMGQSLVDNYFFDVDTNGVVDVDTPVPVPLYFSKNIQFDFIGLHGKYAITENKDDVPTSYNDLTSSSTFRKSVAKDYYIHYKVEDPNSKEEVTSVTKIKVFENGGTSLDLKCIDKDYLINEDITLGYDITNNIQTSVPKVYMKIYKDDELVEDSFECLSDYTYRPTSKGLYRFEYESVDILNRKTIKSFECNVLDIALVAEEKIEEFTYINSIDNLVTPTSQDYYMISASNGQKLTPASVSISIKKDDGEYEYLSKNSITSTGKYYIKYEYKYDLSTFVANRVIFIKDKLPTIQVSEVPKNTKLKEGSSLVDDSIYLYAKKGTQIALSSTYFTSDVPLKYEYIFDNNIKDVTNDFSSYYMLKLENVGVHYISAYIKVGEYVVRKNLIIDVKDNWYSITSIEDITSNVGETIVLPRPVVKDFSGNEVLEGTFEVKYLLNNVEVIDNSSFVASELGIYEVTYKVNDDVYVNYKISTIDTIKPVITIKEYKETVSLGKFVNFATIETSDNSNGYVNVTQSVSFEGKEVLTYNNGFDASNIGTYLIKVTAEDSSGNISHLAYEIEVVEKKGCDGNMDTLPIVMIISALVVLMSLKARKEV